MYAHILVALDGSPTAEQILPHVAALAERFGSKVTLLRVTEPAERLIMATAGTLPLGVPGSPVIDVTPLVEEQRREATSYLESVAARLRGQGLTASYAQPEGSPADMVLQQARDLGADVIALTTHGRGGLGRLVFGSVADAVLRQAPCPILLVRVQEQEEESTAAPHP
jgi:nucleotide-binding universal stress UspA family protein